DQQIRQPPITGTIDQRCASTGGFRLFDEVMAIEPITMQSNEQSTLLLHATIGEHIRQPQVGADLRRSQHDSHFTQQQRVHETRSCKACCTTAASLKANRWSPTI